MVPSAVPLELQNLTQVEEMLIARAFPVMNIYCKPRGGQMAYKGHVITSPSDVQTVADTLPNCPEDLPIIRLISKDDNFQSRDFRVRRSKVTEAFPGKKSEEKSAESAEIRRFLTFTADYRTSS